MVVTTIVALSSIFGAAAGAKTVAPEKWAKSFCVGFSSWQVALASEAATAQDALSGNATDLAAARTKLTTFLAHVVDATNQAVATLKKAGTPDVPKGKQIASVFVTGFHTAVTAFKAAKTDADNVSTTAADLFNSTVKSISATLSKTAGILDSTFVAVDKLDKGSTLSDVLQRVKACAFLKGA